MMRCVRYLAISCILLVLVLSQCTSNTIHLWNGKDFTGWEFVLTNDDIDSNEVWSINNGVIYCRGVPNGYMRTESDYSNYILSLEWRWVEDEGNSGVLLHAQKPYQVWPRCIECQLRSGNAGDFVLMGAGTITVDGEQYTNTARFLGIPKKQDSSEKEIGEWNRYTIICRDDEITCYVNDVLQNEGTQASFTSGKICLQSEGAPIEFRNISLELLN